MKKKKVDVFKKYTPQELVDSFVFRSTLTPEEKIQADNDLREFRKKSLAKMTEGQKMHMRLGSLKYQMEDAVKVKTYDPSTSFGAYLRKYAKMIGRKNYELANDLDLHETSLSQIINRHILPSEKIVYRLEFHSGNSIPAKVWLDVLQRDIENKIEKDIETRKEEYAFVRRHISFLDQDIFVNTKKSDIQWTIKERSQKTAAIQSHSAYASRPEKGWSVKEPKVGYGMKKAAKKK